MGSTAEELAPTVHQLGKGATVWVAGAGDPLLLVHGWGLRPDVYSNGLLHLARHGFYVAAPTMAVVGKQWSIDRAVHRAEKALDHLGWDKAIVAGNSLGGAVAISLAAREPKRIRLLALVNSLGLPLDRNMLGWTLPFRRYITAANLRAAGAFGRNLMAARGAINIAGAAWYARRCALADELETIRRHKVRSVIVWGEDDRLLPLQMGRSVADSLGAPLRLIPGADHDWTIRYPELFARELDIAVRTVLRRRGWRGSGGAGPIEHVLSKRRAAKRAGGSDELPAR
jgi:pimeloyl-ACP methyl ester carboxylesterase